MLHMASTYLQTLTQSDDGFSDVWWLLRKAHKVVRIGLLNCTFHCISTGVRSGDIGGQSLEINLSPKTWRGSAVETRCVSVRACSSTTIVLESGGNDFVLISSVACEKKVTFITIQNVTKMCKGLVYF